jgi:hypothetical protein
MRPDSGENALDLLWSGSANGLGGREDDGYDGREDDPVVEQEDDAFGDGHDAGRWLSI